MSVRNIALFNMLLCGLLTLTGCKTPSWFAFADKTATAPDTQFAATTARAPESGLPESRVPKSQTPTASEPAAPEPTASESTAKAGSWRKATQWLTFRRSHEAPAAERPANERSLERQLSNKAIQPQGLSYMNVPNYPATGPYSPASNRPAVSPADKRLATGTPSLVRRSRRPPPDPAPKLQQDQLLASDAATQNPLANPAAPEATASSSEGSLYEMIESASRAWRTGPSQDASRAVGPIANSAHSPPSAHDNEGLNFLPPNLAKLRTSSDVVASTFSNSSSSADQQAATSAAAQQQNAEPDRTETMPRRENLLASRPLRSQTSPSSDAAADKSNPKSKSVTTSSTTTAGAKWIARRTEPEKEQPETTIASSAETTKPSDSRSVVADTFAANMFSPRKTPGAQSTSESSARPNRETPISNNVPKQRTSVFPLPPTGSPQPSQMVAGLQTALSNRAALSTGTVNDQSLLTASKPQQAVPTQVATDKSTTATGPQVNREAMSPILPATESQDALKRRDTLLPRPVPVTPPPQSYYYYYHRGLMPEAFSLARRPSTAIPTISPTAELAVQSPPAETFAPLIDANTYRQQLSPSQRDWTAATQTGEQSAATGTWLAAYQRLVGSNPKPQSSQPAPQPVTKRSLHSDDSQ